jgi:competence ComEA-like helix-hairpin-helix protein
MNLRKHSRCGGFPDLFFSCAMLLLCFSSANAAAKKQLPARPFDLNTATLKQLEELPGVGPVTAHAILDFREKSGPFKSVNDLLVIPRISKKKLEKIRPYVFVKPEAPAKKSAAPPAKKHATAFYRHRQNSDATLSTSKPATSAAEAA